MIDNQKQSDRRQFGRRWVCVHGWICVDGRPRIACTVKDFSPAGALLEIVSPTRLPCSFRLVIDTIGFEIGCEVMRVDESAVGVKFTNTASVRPDGSAMSLDDMIRSTSVWMRGAVQPDAAPRDT